MVAMVFMQTPRPILSDENNSMFEDGWNLPTDTQDCQRALQGAPRGTPSVCQLPGGPTLKINPWTGEAVCFGFCMKLLYQIQDTDCDPKYT